METEVARLEYRLRESQTEAESLRMQVDTAARKLKGAETKATGLEAEKKTAGTALKAAEAAAEAARAAQAKSEAALASIKTKSSAALTDKKQAEEAAKEAQRELSAVQAALRLSREAAAKAQQDAEVAKKRYTELSSRHAGAWVPHWLESSLGAAVNQATPALARAAVAAKEAAEHSVHFLITTWQTQGRPALERAGSLARAKAAEASEALQQRSGLTLQAMPAVPAAVSGAFAEGKRLALAAWHSEALAQVRPALAAAAAGAAALCGRVVSELEPFIVRVLGLHPALAPLVPFSSFLLYGLLGESIRALIVACCVGRHTAARPSLRCNSPAVPLWIPQWRPWWPWACRRWRRWRQRGGGGRRGPPRGAPRSPLQRRQRG